MMTLPIISGSGYVQIAIGNIYNATWHVRSAHVSAGPRHDILCVMSGTYIWTTYAHIYNRSVHNLEQLFLQYIMYTYSQQLCKCMCTALNCLPMLSYILYNPNSSTGEVSLPAFNPPHCTCLPSGETVLCSAPSYPNSERVQCSAVH